MRARDELSRELRDALDHVETAWTHERADETWRGLRVKRTRRTVVRSTAAAAAVALVAGGAYYLARGGSVGTDRVPRVAQPTPHVTPLPPEPSPEVTALVVLEDGTVVTAAGADAAVEVVADARERAEVRVVKGKTRFDAPKTPDREFRVTSGDVKIDVYATQFSVARFDGRTEVWTDEGVLRIEWRGKTQEVRAGEHAQFPPDAIDVPPAGTEPEQITRPPRTPREHVRDLMRMADNARDARRPRDAVRPLSRVVKEYAKDSRAPMAAFTLGRVLLDDLDEPRRAARAFRKARALAPRGPLAEDSLAREAEAWARAGEPQKAADRAAMYLERYPDGHRVRAMKKYVH